MKRYTFILLAFCLMACAASGEKTAKDQKEIEKPTLQPEVTEEKLSEDKPLIVVTFYPIYDFTTRIAGDQADIISLVPLNQEVHGWEPKPSDVSKLAQADLIITNGLGLETWLEDLLIASQTEARLIDTSEKIEAIEAGQEHGHHEEESSHHDHGQGFYDPHIWLSLKNAVLQMETIRDALIELDPENASIYKDNFEKAQAELYGLNETYKAGLEAGRHRELVVPHEAFAYLFKDYGLKQIGIEGVLAEGDPSAAALSEILTKAQTSGIKIFFYEAGGDSRHAEVLAAEVGGEALAIYTCETQVSPEMDYLKMMDHNLRVLTEAVQ